MKFPSFKPDKPGGAQARAASSAEFQVISEFPYGKAKGIGILFVCRGNICRSPMAVGIARKRLGNEKIVESAGILPSPGKAAEEAVLVMKAVYGVDISDHWARDVADVDLSPYDYIIALDLSIYARLREANRIPEEKLFSWDIEDPMGQGYQACKQAARKIEKRLEQFLENQGLGL